MTRRVRRRAVGPLPLWGLLVGLVLIWRLGLLGALASAAVAAGCAALARAGRRLRRPRAEAVLVEWLRDTASGLRAGANLPEALAAPRRQLPAPLAQLRDDLRVRGTATALERWRPQDLPGLTRFVLGGLALGHRAGTLDARTVERLAGATERRLVLAADARAQAATARLSALLLVLAPLGVAALAVSGDGGHAAFLLTHPAGRACAVAGVGLDLIGWWWMRRIIAGVVR